MSTQYFPPSPETPSSQSNYLSHPHDSSPFTSTSTSASTSSSNGERARARGGEGEEDASKPKDFIKVMGGKTPSKFTDPCAHAAKLSMKCLDDNAYDRSKCGDVFNQ
ncbi:hypothetical protein BCV70DRAFT_200207 [Testicularia cyperi]|uniref:Uncharacterized protein n=1 Tax=Testicularia cyperi TaxID=1882483 RepID=A0A317XP00_9BASI|nr:hypothetical protein BCV70DRAFT_200207 [Testicularia cyperi]